MSLFDALSQNAVLFYGVVVFLGLFVGSFLNVVIHRLPIMMENEWRRGCEAMMNDGEEPPAGEPYNLAVPRSRCPKCNTLINALQNIPVISYIFLRGKCGNCGTPISLRYPLVELITAALSLICAWHFGPSIQAVAAIIITWCLIALSAIDFDKQLLPDDITLPLMWLGLIASLFGVFVSPGDAIVGAAAGYLTLWLVYQVFKLLTGKEGMGYGDFKLLAALGAWFGWQALPMIILLSSLVGAAVGITLIVARGRDRQVPIPFGPYLAAAGWLAMVWGDRISSFYSGFYT